MKLLGGSSLLRDENLREALMEYIKVKEKEWNEYAALYRWENTWDKITEWEYAHYLDSA